MVDVCESVKKYMCLTGFSIVANCRFADQQAGDPGQIPKLKPRKTTSAPTISQSLQDGWDNWLFNLA